MNIRIGVVEQRFDQNNLIDKVAVFLKDLSRNEFFGTVEIQFINGELVLVRKEETFKPVAFLK